MRAWRQHFQSRVWLNIYGTGLGAKHVSSDRVGSKSVQHDYEPSMSWGHSGNHWGGILEPRLHQWHCIPTSSGAIISRTPQGENEQDQQHLPSWLVYDQNFRQQMAARKDEVWAKTDGGGWRLSDKAIRQVEKWSISTLPQAPGVPPGESSEPPFYTGPDRYPRGLEFYP